MKAGKEKGGFLSALKALFSWRKAESSGQVKRPCKADSADYFFSLIVHSPTMELMRRDFRMKKHKA